jgi:hypothetical protein
VTDVTPSYADVVAVRIDDPEVDAPPVVLQRSATAGRSRER